MSRISLDAMVRAIRTVQALSLRQKENLVDEIFRTQPNMLNSVLALQNLGVSTEKMDFAFNMLLICFQAMKESGLTWPLIAEDEQARQLQIYTRTVRFGEELGEPLRDRLMQQYIEGHPEQNLLAYVGSETANWLKRITSQDNDKYVMLAAANLVNCIAFVPMTVPG